VAGAQPRPQPCQSRRVLLPGAKLQTVAGVGVDAGDNADIGVGGEEVSRGRKGEKDEVASMFICFVFFVVVQHRERVIGSRRTFLRRE